MDEASHKKYTGVSNKPILENLERLAKNGSNVMISLPIIPNLNDDEANILRTGEFIASLASVEHVSLLPYHKAGIDKYKNMGRPYRLKSILSPSDQEMATIKEKLETFGLKVKIGER
jgi:pyruvate formate lyase activating enzyme